MRKIQEDKCEERNLTETDTGKRHGTCFRCGINCTPLSHVEPVDKSVLCNACGSRYRKRGSLEDYFPGNTNNREKLNHRKNPLVSCYLTGENSHLWSPKIPTRKRSRVVYKKLTPMERFQNQLIRMWKSHGNPNEPSPDEVLLSNNMNNFIPSNEIGLGVVLLNPDDASA